MADIVSPPTISVVPRSQSIKYTLDGNTAIDRIGGLKYSISLTFPMVTGERWNALVDVFSEMSFPVSFSHNGLTRDRTFRIDGAIPSPLAVLIAGRYYFSNITINLEEM